MKMKKKLQSKSMVYMYEIVKNTKNKINTLVSFSIMVLKYCQRQVGEKKRLHVSGNNPSLRQEPGGKVKKGPGRNVSYWVALHGLLILFV